MKEQKISYITCKREKFRHFMNNCNGDWVQNLSEQGQRFIRSQDGKTKLKKFGVLPLQDTDLHSTILLKKSYWY